MKKVVFLAIAIVFAATTFAQNDTCNCPGKVKVTKNHSGGVTKAGGMNIDNSTTITFAEGNYGGKDKTTFITLPNSGNNAGMILGIIALCVAIAGIVALIVYNKQGNNTPGIQEYIDTELVDAIGCNGGVYDHKFRTKRGIEKVRLSMFAPNATTAGLRQGNSRQA